MRGHPFIHAQETIKSGLPANLVQELSFDRIETLILHLKRKPNKHADLWDIIYSLKSHSKPYI